MNNNIEVANFLEKFIGKADNSTGSPEFIYHCPVCKHHKKKLQIHLDRDSKTFGYWNCWTCTPKSSGKNVLSLLNLISKHKRVLKDDIDDLKSMLPNTNRNNFNITVNEETERVITLPQEFKSLTKKSEDPEYKNALYYAINVRKLTPQDIIRYNIGYCDSGRYSGRLIIPSYDSNFELNYFQARAYYKEDQMRYNNPKIDYNSIIGFESMIDWNSPITLVEGALDAIGVRQNCIPSFGKNVSDKLRLKILEMNVRDINIFLDPDAIKNSIDLAKEFLSSGRRVKMIISKGDDPSKMGYKRCTELIKNSKIVNEYDLMKLRLT